MRAANFGPAAGLAQSIEDHIEDAIRKVPNLNPRQRDGMRNAMLQLSRDVSSIRLLVHKARGPWSDLALRADDGWPPH